MSKFKVKAEKLTEIVNEEIDYMKSKPYLETTSFCIHDEGDMQVKVVITKDEDEFCDSIVKGYE